MVRSLRRNLPALATALFAAVWLSPAAALACPYCAGNGKSGIATGIILASFVFLPFGVVYAVYRFIRSEKTVDKVFHPYAHATRREAE